MLYTHHGDQYRFVISKVQPSVLRNYNHSLPLHVNDHNLISRIVELYHSFHTSHLQHAINNCDYTHQATIESLMTITQGVLGAFTWE